eukprot:TRINITY_DN1368_c0_g1_i1.p1 TRINITY_DN1368_c0_g1~~TRINITY_DN1368_c0_g1_i1.p1  ORF type:complete len:344 (+),score=70.85 TRINITY_DN1368_c0_g1_i1:218-1249(+)
MTILRGLFVRMFVIVVVLGTYSWIHVDGVGSPQQQWQPKQQQQQQQQHQQQASDFIAGVTHHDDPKMAFNRRDVQKKVVPTPLPFCDCLPLPPPPPPPSMLEEFHYDEIYDTSLEFDQLGRDIFQISIAFLFGCVIGFERRFSTRSHKGLVYAIISTATCLFTILSPSVQYLFLGVGNVDPMRIVSGCVTGVGWLGSAFILKQESERRVQGLIHACMIWTTAGIGIAIGFQCYLLATYTTFVLLSMLQLPKVYQFFWMKFGPKDGRMVNSALAPHGAQGGRMENGKFVPLDDLGGSVGDNSWFTKDSDRGWKARGSTADHEFGQSDMDASLEAAYSGADLGDD